VKSCLKIIIAAIGLVLILVAIGALLAATQIEKAAKTGIEGTLSHVFMTDVTVESVELSALGQSLDIRGLHVKNPATFKTAAAMEFKRVLVEVDGKTLFSRTPTIKRVLIKEPIMHLRYELAEGTNLGMLAKHAGRLAEAEDSQDETPEKPAKEEEPGARIGFRVEELRCEGAKVALSTNLIPLSGVELDVADFTLNNLSKDRPVTTAETCAIFIRSLLRETLSVKGLLRPVADRIRKETHEPAPDSAESPSPEPSSAEKGKTRPAPRPR
jgi:hypothetical protein